MKLKKLMVASLLGATLASVIFCSSVQKTDEQNITASVSSSVYSDYLSDRLAIMPDSLIIAAGADTAAYGVDTSKFIDDEGYTINAKDGDVIILGKTDAGLDRAVRHFANYGNNDNYSFTYGEGYRVKSLTVNGHSISEYAIIRPDDADECMIYASDELARYISLTCGTTLPVYSAGEYESASSKPERTINLIIDYPTHGDESFTVSVKDDGNLDILCGRFRGGLYGVYGLLKDIGWRFIGDGTEYLYEAESVDLTSEINRTEEPAIPNRFASAYPTLYDFPVANKMNLHGRYVNDSAMSRYGYYGIVAEACHGLDSHNIDWQGTYDGLKTEGKQPCFTNEDVLQAIEDHFRSYIDARLAAGAVPGKDLCYIDVSQFDSTSFCQCTSCIDVLQEEQSTCGAVLRMTNRMAEMAAEYSPEISALLLAYAGTNKPPAKTVPLENVKISYCFYTGNGITCSNHNITGEDCGNDGYTNKGFHAEFEDWKAICPSSNLQVWYYPFNCYEVAFQTPCYDTAFGDIKYLIDSNIDCLMLCEGDNNDSILISLIAALAWDGDMTEDEYNALLEQYFNILYGDSGKYIYEYSKIILKAGDLNGCWCAFHGRALNKVNKDFIATRFDYLVELFDKALKYAENEAIFKKIEILRARMLYMGISVVHEDRYTNGTDSDRAMIEELYADMHSLFRKYGLLVFNDFITLYGAPETFDVTKNPSEHWCVFPE